MPATKRRIALDIYPATATHCGDGIEACGAYIDYVEECGAFGGKALAYDEAVQAFKRLPECIAAEGKREEQHGE